MKLTNFICLFPENFFSDQVSITKCCWETNKMKSANFNLKSFEKYKQNAKKVEYKRPNWIKTRCSMIKWIFQKLEVFEFFEVFLKPFDFFTKMFCFSFVSTKVSFYPIVTLIPYFLKFYFYFLQILKLKLDNFILSQFVCFQPNPSKTYWNSVVVLKMSCEIDKVKLSNFNLKICKN